ncbi:MAG: glutamine--tRNA ligase/YqeY domain fusion protein [Phycisphaerales bacterium]|nr:glutamine--tRNA ligase/YqeY domain fusion protein [Phycisphaerales bacterium]
MTTPTEEKPTDFIRTIVADDVANNKNDARVHTRFPPEPNGYLHIGHAKAICIDFGIAAEFGGKCNLRMDDTNPIAEEQEFVDAIQEDIKWLGWDWTGGLFFASDYFEQMYEFAVQLVKDGKAYVDDLSAEDIREYRGTLNAPGKDSPFRDRPVDESLDLFERMKAGEFPDGSRVLRAKIDMASPNFNMRDPVMYRILHAEHPHRGDSWCIYPMYDWAHGIEDSLEGVTHSLCDLDFENHRPLYDWFLDQLGVHHPQQIEFARFNLTYTVTSKRKLKQLVEAGLVSGWDDPRLPTLRGLRRRGFTAEAICAFMKHIGVNKFISTVDSALLEHFVRKDLNKTSPRVMGVLKPLKVVIDNYPEDQTDQLDAVNNPEDEAAGTRQVPFSKVIYIEQEDFMEDPPKKFFRLSVGREVRLRYAYFITCNSVVKDDDGNVIELHCTYDPETRGGDAPDGRRVKATLHWVSAPHALDAEIRLYDHLFTKENPSDVGKDENWLDGVNPESIEVLTGCKIEPSLAGTQAGARVQFERQGYFCIDPDTTEDKLVINRTLSLKDSWAKIQKQNQQKQKNQQKQQQKQKQRAQKRQQHQQPDKKKM